MNGRVAKKIRKILRNYKNDHDYPPSYKGNAKNEPLFDEVNGKFIPLQFPHPGTLEYANDSYRKVYQSFKKSGLDSKAVFK